MMATRNDDASLPSAGSVNLLTVPQSMDAIEFDGSGNRLPEIVVEEEGEPPAAATNPGAEEGEGGGGGVGVVASSIVKSGKPQVTVRIRPSVSSDNNVFEVDSDMKTIQIRVEREVKIPDPRQYKPPPSFMYFPADNVLEISSQEETFTAVCSDIVEKAMQGVSGMVVAVGPELSGKSYSLFGFSGPYGNRGMAARALEKMFEIKDRMVETADFKFGLGIVEVRRERIRDLLTLGPYEINDVGERGPKGMFIEEMENVEHGIGLMLRALIGQKMIHSECYERYHTVVYFEIVAISPVEPDLVLFNSKITFAEIASAPVTKLESLPNSCSRENVGNVHCVSSNTKLEPRYKPKQAVFPNRKCCNPGYTSGPLAESIAVRRDVFALEQMFLRAAELSKLRKYFARLEDLGISMLASEKRKISGGHNIRQNKLAHCLKDILDGTTEIQILLHVRPDKAYLKTSLEAMRFAERARLVPTSLGPEPIKAKSGRTEEQILQEVITDIAPELAQPANMELLTTEKMKLVQEQAVNYFENNIDSMKICSKEKVKLMFENFRVLWNFLWELELNVSLRKAEEDIREAMSKAPAWSNALSVNRMDGADEDVQGTPSMDLVGKKSGRKKKDKSRKKREARKSAMLISLDKPEEEMGKNGSLGDAGAGEGADNSQPALADEQAKPEDEVRGSLPAAEQPPTPSAAAAEDVPPPTTLPALVEAKAPSGNKQSGDTASNLESLHGHPPSSNLETTPSKLHLNGQPPHPNGDENAHNFAEFIHANHNLRRSIPLEQNRQSSSERKSMSEEERLAQAAKMEQQLSENFEEMKKVARRQAAHLLRAGVKKPKWVTLF